MEWYNRKVGGASRMESIDGWVELRNGIIERWVELVEWKVLMDG